MKIQVKSIEAEIIDTSTHNGTDFLIKSWIINYEIYYFANTFHGNLHLNVHILPNEQEIIQAIQKSLKTIIQ